MAIITFFFDTYAFFELVEGNPNYLPYTEHVGIITTKLNLMELHYGLMRDYDEEIANTLFDELRQFCIEIDDKTIREANIFRLQNYKRELSHVDCIGYTLAKQRGVKFLSGDTQFESFENVEFVK
ncbi:MAG TPA: PIN domain-containing protein [Candidatus Nanoarchaeia archaeon]|nr:PIN domain-containing protein [Candidatus Nanoarchaeia archaeon]